MKWLWTSLVITIFSTVAVGQQINLDGILIMEDGKPVPNIRVTIAEQQSQPTDKNGKFSVALPPNIREGERVVITVNGKYAITEPPDGDWIVPAIGPKNILKLDIVVVAWDSRVVWATTQNTIGNTLRDQATSVEGAEAARLFGEAAAAYHRALLVFTRDSMPEDWATTQHNLGYVLQEQGVRTNGPEAARLLSDAVAAYKQALQIRTREQLPLHWAMTQNDLGNALQAQGVRADGPEASRLLTEAAAAYGEALLVFTREFMPRQWAMTQHNLGSALHEQGTRTDGPAALNLLCEAVAAYRQALLVRTREQMPRQWAITQNNLGNALQAQGTRSEKAEDALRLLSEALVAYREALLVFTREQSLSLWAMAKHNVGSALQEQATRREGPESARLFGEAVQAYRDALTVWTREQRPQQWAMAQNNLARAHFNLKEWLSAAASYENVLEVYPQFRPAYEKARFLEHEVLLNFPRALILNESWLKLNSGDRLATATFAENLFTTGNFEECGRRVSALLSDARLDAQIKIPLRALEIANLIALNRSAEVPAKLKDLIAVIENQPADFKVQWSFAGVKQFINTSKQLEANRKWLLELCGAMEAENRNVIVEKLRIASETLKS